MCFVLQTVARKKKATNLAFGLAAQGQRLAHHSVVSGCYLADPWICVCEGEAEEAQCPRNLICGAGPVGRIDHWRLNAFVLKELGLFKNVNAIVSWTQVAVSLPGWPEAGLGNFSDACLQPCLPLSFTLLFPPLASLPSDVLALPILPSKRAAIAACALWNYFIIHRNLFIHNAKRFFSHLKVIPPNMEIAFVQGKAEL